MNFILFEMTYLRCFVPLIIEGNRRGYKSRMFIGANTKYNCPYKNIECLKKLSEQYRFEIRTIKEINQFKDITFLVEGVGGDYVPREFGIMSLVYGTDFLCIGKSYIDKVDKMIFPSEFLAKYYKWVTPKNLYLGDPKYDVYIDKDFVLNKYKISTDKNALIIFPQAEVLDRIDLTKIYGYLKKLGYTIIVKSRGKHFVEKKFRADMFFEDFSWYPHSTMELITVSDIIVNFNSAAMEECVMLEKPFVNFDLKKARPLDFLYDYKYCSELKPNIDEKGFGSCVNNLVSNNWSSEFMTAKNNHLFDSKGISKNILDKVGI